MKVARSEHTICFDVDDTLIMWDSNFNMPEEGDVEIQCPWDGQISFHRPHTRHIEFLKKQYTKGYTVIVWSAGGAKWAETVVKTLGIEDYVDYVMSKPQKWVDDLIQADQVLGTHIYLSEEGFSK